MERRFAWLLQEFGPDSLRSPVILPTPEYFPGEYDPTVEDVQALLEQVATWMSVDPTTLRLDFFDDPRSRLFGAGAVGLYQEHEGGYTIALNVNCIEQPLQVVATLAHEIGHVVLLGQKRITADEEDQEQLTDLLTVFLGLGVLTANATLHEASWHAGNQSGWSMQRQGYLSLNAFGYALALYALARKETSPSWLSFLRGDVRAACREGIRYLQQSRQDQVSPNSEPAPSD